MAASDWALAVGIRLYPELGDLDGPENDALAFHAWVTSPAGGAVPPAQARRIVSSNYDPFASWMDAKPVRDQVEEFFWMLDEIAKKNSSTGDGLQVGRRIYLYFAGHGLCPRKFVGEEESDDAALLMANAGLSRPGLHVAGKAWADRLYFSGFFEEVLLFMDCCRDNYPQVPLNNPTIVQRKRPDNDGPDKRFYAFATKWSRRSWERPMSDGKVHGVFTQTLLSALEGGASHAVRGDITAGTLKSFLFGNFAHFLDPADVANPGVEKEPDVFFKGNEDQFVIVSRPRVTFPVTIQLPAEVMGRRVRVLDGADQLKEVDAITAAEPTWTVPLPRGTYLIEVEGDSKVARVEVTGTGAQNVPL